MKHKLVLIMCFAGLLSCTTKKSIKRITSVEKAGLKREAKTITMYSYAENKLDTLAANNELSFSGVPKYIYHYMKDGKLEQEFINLKDSSQNEITFNYDKENNLASKIIKNSDNGLSKKYLFQYNHKDLEVLELIDSAKYTLTKSNKDGEAIEVVYFDKYGKIDKTYNYYYEENAMIRRTISRTDSIEHKSLYAYDEKGRIITKKFFDGNEDFIRKIVFFYPDENSTKVLEYDKNNKLIKESKKIRFKDEHNNLVKEYFFRFNNKTTIITEFKIEYY